MIYYIDHVELEKFTRAIFMKLGFSEEHANIVAGNLVLANLRGVDSHGVVRIPYYAEGVESGKIIPRPVVKILREGSFYALVDGDKALGHIPAKMATDIAISKARKEGIGFVGAINIWHVGMLASYVLSIVRERMIGVAMANVSPNIGLPGFKKPVVGTNPIAIGFPTDSAPILLDMALSVVARGKILVAAEKGEKIPKGWALSKDGEETTDPVAAIEGMLLPIGGYKGFGLAMAVDILCGIVLGGVYGLKMQRSWFSQGGFLVMAIRADLMRSYDEYLRDLKEYIENIKATPTAEGIRVLIPNEIEEENMRKRLVEGIPIDDRTLKELNKLASKYGIKPLTPLRNTRS
ncbi:MAG: Ldh family oxidoreductase [Desulfurococcales archaeon]|nr:Ldh family oxidoreductase [Desulfurococcales archaeon]MDT7890404.1 Ldh family oxidoreductase [Desulfurococcales archaeon]